MVVSLQGYSRESFNAQLREQFVAGLATALLITPVSVIILAVTSAPPAPAVGRRALRQAGVVPSPPPPPAPLTGGSVSVLVAIYEPGPGGLTAVEVVNRLSALTPLTLAVALRQAGLTSLTGVTTSNLAFTRPWPSPPLAPRAPPHPPLPLPPKHETVAETAKLAAGVGGAVGGVIVLSLAVGLSLCLYRRRRARKQGDAEDEAVPPFKMDTPMWTAADLPLVSKVTADGARSRHNWDSAGEDGSAHELATRLISILPPLPQPPLPRAFDPNELPDTQEASSAALAAIFAPPGATPDEREVPYINTWQNERVAAAAILVDEAVPLLPLPRAQREAATAAAEREHRKHRSRERSGSRHRRHDDAAPDGERHRHRHRHRSSSRRQEDEAAPSGERPRRTPYGEASGDPAVVPTRSGEVRTRSRSRSTPRYEADSVAVFSGDGRAQRAGSPVRERSDRRRHHRSPRRGHGDSDLDRL